MIDQLKKLVEPMQRRVMLMVGRCVLNAVYDGNPVQLVQASLLADETRDKVERMSEYGFTSVPHPGAQGVAVFVGGERGHGIVIATGDHRYRLKGLEAGEVAIYTDEGDSVVLKRGKLIEVTTDTFVVKAATKVQFETPLVEATAKIEAGGDILDNSAANPRTMKGMRDQYNIHTHNDPQGGQVAPPLPIHGM